MRNPARIDRMVELLRRLWDRSPDQRMGQLVMNACRDLTKAWPDIWNVEDNELEAAMRAELEDA